MRKTHSAVISKLSNLNNDLLTFILNNLSNEAMAVTIKDNFNVTTRLSYNDRVEISKELDDNILINFIRVSIAKKNTVYIESYDIIKSKIA